jgi:hypothetical protein
MTRELIANMLGVRREGVTEVAGREEHRRFPSTCASVNSHSVPEPVGVRIRGRPCPVPMSRRYP